MLDRVLIANRGEIAHRLVSHYRALGVHTVAVYSDADADAPHVRAASAAVRLGPPPVAESYLNAPALLEAARTSGAQAIHPGYGLLSENAGFAQLVRDAGLVFIGPPPSAIAAMGDKVAAREVARRCGLPTVPGSDGAVSDEDAPSVAEAVGYPVLIKASAGGGGIGMEVAASPEKLLKAIGRCRSRAARAFGSDTVYLERYVDRPRHIEIQVLFDAHGTGVSLFERECSVQRRHQKLVEEGPSVVMDRFPGLREAMGAAAVRLGQEVGYVGVGTVEFLVDLEGRFYFMEMNTRLQVEHPVTEAITGLDLPGWQLRVARGERLDAAALAPRISGHAIEVRVCAEDPSKGFLPQPGQLTALAWPFGVRVDSGVELGSTVAPFYDSLLAKIIAWGPTRGDAIARLEAALDETRLEGVTSNLDFHRWLVRHPAFRAGELSTRFVDEHWGK